MPKKATVDRKLLFIIVLVVTVVISEIIGCNHVESINHETPAPGYSIVTDGNGNYAARHDGSGHILTPGRLVKNKFSKQSAINWSWKIHESRDELEQFQKKWK